MTLWRHPCQRNCRRRSGCQMNFKGLVIGMLTQDYQRWLKLGVFIIPCIFFADNGRVQQDSPRRHAVDEDSPLLQPFPCTDLMDPWQEARRRNTIHGKRYRRTSRDSNRQTDWLMIDCDRRTGPDCYLLSSSCYQVRKGRSCSRVHWPRLAPGDASQTVASDSFPVQSSRLLVWRVRSWKRDGLLPPGTPRT